MWASGWACCMRYLGSSGKSGSRPRSALQPCSRRLQNLLPGSRLPRQLSPRTRSHSTASTPSALTLSNMLPRLRLRDARTHHPRHRLADRGTASAAATTMVLEATMICVDNSEWMRNGDYHPSRFAAQANAVAVLCGAKMPADQESTVGVVAMAGRGPSVLVWPTDDLGKVLSGMHGLQIGGEANLNVAIQIAQLALKNRQNKQLQQRIIVFIGSPVIDDKNVLEAIGKKLKKNNVALDVVDFGESDKEKPEKLEALVAAVNSGGNSHVIHIPAGDVLIDAIISSPILPKDKGSDSAAAASGASGFEFGVYPDLALALQISMEEERARKKAATEKATEESSKTESKNQSSTLNDDTVMADAESEPDPYTEDKRLLQTDEENQLLQQAQAMSLEDVSTGTVLAAAAELLEKVTAIQMSGQEEETGTQSDASLVFLDQQFSGQSPTNTLPDVDINDISNKDLLEWKELLIGPSEPKKQGKTHKKQQQQKSRKKKQEKKEDEPEGDKSQ